MRRLILGRLRGGIGVTGNLKMFLITAQQSREDAHDICEASGLSQKTVDTIHNYPLPS
jgi:hypothetical protein